MAEQRARVAALSATAVKSLRIARPRALWLDLGGARGDRRFFLIDDAGRMVNAKRHGELQQVEAELGEDEVLTLRLPGTEVRGPVRLGERLQAAFYSGQREVRLLEGPFSAALSEHVGAPLRLG